MTPPGSMKKLRKFESQFCNFTNKSPFFKPQLLVSFCLQARTCPCLLAIFTLFLTVLFFPTQLNHLCNLYVPFTNELICS